MNERSGPRVFVTRRLPGDALSRLAGEVELDLWQEARPPGPEELRQHTREAEGLLCLLCDRVDEALLAASPRLRVISSYSVGVDHLDLAAATARGIPVGHTPGVLTETTADLAFALLLAAARRIPEADRFVREGHWQLQQGWQPHLLLGRDVHGATLGILGLGPIGRAVARRARGFDMRVIGWTPSGRHVPGIELMGLEEVLEHSDFVSLHLALAAGTRGLLDGGRLRRMKRGAILVNTARGGIVDEAELARALCEGRLAAAALDVFSREPLEPDSPLLRAPNLVLAPHIGSASVATREAMAEQAVRNLLAGLRGERLPHCANPEVYAPAGGGEPSGGSGGPQRSRKSRGAATRAPR